MILEKIQAPITNILSGQTELIVMREFVGRF